MDSAADERLSPARVDPARIFDVGVAGYLLDSDSGSFDAASLAEKYLAAALPEPTEGLPAAAILSVGVRELVPVLADRLEADGSRGLFTDIEMPLLPVLAQMEREGLGVDVDVLREQSAELGAEIDGMVARIKAEAGRTSTSTLRSSSRTCSSTFWACPPSA